MLNHDESNPRLRTRFASALRQAGSSTDGAAVFDQIVRRYDEAHRHYHTLVHVDACLGWLEPRSTSKSATTRWNKRAQS